MFKILYEKTREAFFSVLPVTLIVLLLSFTPLADFSLKELVVFCICAVFLVVGIGSALLRGVSPVVFILCAGVLGVAVRVWLSRGKEGQA